VGKRGRAYHRCRIEYLDVATLLCSGLNVEVEEWQRIISDDAAAWSRSEHLVQISKVISAGSRNQQAGSLHYPGLQKDSRPWFSS
jgi:hypothetical protein